MLDSPHFTDLTKSVLAKRNAIVEAAFASGREEAGILEVGLHGAADQRVVVDDHHRIAHLTGTGGSHGLGIHVLDLIGRSRGAKSGHERLDIATGRPERS